MKRKPYIAQEKEILLQPIAIEKIANSSVAYKKEFKLYAVGEYLCGKNFRNCNNERCQWSRNKMTPVQYRSHLFIDCFLNHPFYFVWLFRV